MIWSQNLHVLFIFFLVVNRLNYAIHLGRYVSDNNKISFLLKSHENCTLTYELLYFVFKDQTYVAKTETNRQKTRIITFYVEISRINYEFIIVDDYTIYGKKEFARKFNLQTNHKLAEIAVILDKREKCPAATELFLHAKVPVQFWPSVSTGECPTDTVKSHRSRSKEHGILVAHQQIVSDFYFRKRKQIVPGNRTGIGEDVLIIFEHDVVCTFVNCAELVFNEISKLTSDVLFLGWCYWGRFLPSHLKNTRKPKKYPPLCAHAYAISVTGAMNLHNNINQCGEAYDMQLRHLGATKKITWAAANDSKAIGRWRRVPHRHPFGNGLFVQKFYNSGGSKGGGGGGGSKSSATSASSSSRNRKNRNDINTSSNTTVMIEIVNTTEAIELEDVAPQEIGIPLV